MATKLTEPTTIDGLLLSPIPTNPEAYKGLLGYRCGVCGVQLRVWFGWGHLLVVISDSEPVVDSIDGAVVNGRDLYLCMECVETLTANLRRDERAEDLLTLMLIRGW